MEQRLDLDGITLHPAAGGQTVAVLRYRTAEGLMLRQPESVDMLVPWGEVEDADIDLQAGTVTVRFSGAFVARSNWLSGASELVGRWTDRVEVKAAHVG